MFIHTACIGFRVKDKKPSVGHAITACMSDLPAEHSAQAGGRRQAQAGLSIAEPRQVIRTTNRFVGFGICDDLSRILIFSHFDSLTCWRYVNNETVCH